MHHFTAFFIQKVSISVKKKYDHDNPPKQIHHTRSNFIGEDKKHHTCSSTAYGLVGKMQIEKN